MPPIRRVRLIVSSAISLVLIVAGAAAPRTDGRLALVYALTLLIGFWIPAQWLESVAGIRRRWGPLLGWTVLSTLFWDLATARAAGHRSFLSEWPLVYTSGPATLLLLLLGHAWLTVHLQRRWQRAEP